MDGLILNVQGLRKHFPITKGLIFMKTVAWVKAVDGIDFTLHQGQTFGLVGESGCGKTTTAKVVLMLERPTSGSILFQGEDIFALEGWGLGEYRRSVQAVFQDPYSSLNPRMRVGDIIGEPLIGDSFHSRAAIQERVGEVLLQVGLNRLSASLYPHEFSGGQRQRIAVARALAPRSNCIILDEPVSALDVSIRAQILNLLLELQERFELSYLLIAHDLAVVRYMSQSTGVMYLGKIVEKGNSEEVYGQPLHPYTQALFSAVLPHHPDAPRRGVILSGEVPSPLNPPSGCRFHPRCYAVKEVCPQVEPELKEVAPRHQVACHLY